VSAQFVPFIQGPRNCLGQYFALLEARIVLALLVKARKARLALALYPICSGPAASAGGLPHCLGVSARGADACVCQLAMPVCVQSAQLAVPVCAERWPCCACSATSYYVFMCATLRPVRRA